MAKKKIKTLLLFSIIIQSTLSFSSLIVILLLSWLSEMGVVSHSPVTIALIVFSSHCFNILLSFALSYSFVKSIVSVGEATKKIAKGDFTVRLNEQKTEELQALADDFNFMAAELSRSELLSSDFIQNVSHEIKTPISKIKGYCELLQNKNLPCELQDKYLRIIIQNSEQISTLTGNILLLSKLENGEKLPPKEHFLLDEELRKVVILFQKEWAEKNIDINFDCHQLPCYASKELLIHVWQNLLSNGIKYTPENGKIKITARKENDKIIVKFSDNGIGMTEDERQRIFDKFYQADRSHGASGNGLGLAITKQVLTLCDAEIFVSSYINEGSCFTVVLPIE